MNRIATTILVVLLLAPGAIAESGCADCGGIVAPMLRCVPGCSTAMMEVTEWGVVNDPVCVSHCRILSCLPFLNRDCRECDACCDGGCGSSKHCQIRGRNRLLRKTLVEYIPVSDCVVAPICQNCLYQRLEAEPIPVPDASPAVAPLIDAVDLQKSDVTTVGPVHWIYSDTMPTGASVRRSLPQTGLKQLELASPLQALTSPQSLPGPTTTYPIQR